MSANQGRKITLKTKVAFIASLAFCFLFVNNSAQALHSTSTYFKNPTNNNTLTSEEWNNLLYDDSGNVFGDFVNTWLPARMNGPLGIATSAPASGLEVNGPIVGTTLSGIYNGLISAGNVISGSFGSNAGGGNFSFPGNVGIGTTNPGNALHVYQSGTGYQVPVMIQNPGDPGNGSTRFVVQNSVSSFYLQAYGSASPGSLASAASIWAVSGSKLLLGAGAGMGVQLVSNNDYNNPQFVLTSGGNIGIGTTTPSAPLYVAKNSSAPEIVIHNTGGGGGSGFRFIDDLSSSDFRFKAITSGGFKIRDNTYSLDVLQIENNSAANSLYIKSGGNIGLGTTTPSARLEVLPSGSYSILAGSGRIGNLGDPVLNTDAVNKSYLDAAITNAMASTSVGYWTANGANIYNNNAGNIGIGTTTPSYKLDVNGSARFANVLYLGNTGNINLGVDPLATNGYFDIRANGTGGYSLGYNQGSGNLTYYGGTTAAKFSVTSAGLGYFSGNVGIGTTSPTAKLQVIGGNIGLSNGSAITWRNSGAAVEDGEIYLNASNQLALNSGTGEAIIFNSNNGATEWMRATSGNLGIGTTSPTTRLEVAPNGTWSIFAGNARIGNVADPGLGTDAATKNYVDSMSGGGIAAGTTGQTLRHNGTSWIATSNLYNNGTNIGMGTTVTTAARLTLADHTTTAGGIRFRTAATAVDLYSSGSGILKTAASFEAGSYKVGTTEVIDSSRNIIAGNGSAGAPSVRSSSYTTTGLFWAAGPILGFTTNGSERMRINSNGNVGIGTTSPTTRLEVAANGSYSIYAGSARIGNMADPVASSDAATKGYVDTMAGDPIGSGTTGQTLRHNGTSWVANSTLYNNGTNVGIGTTNPLAKLEVNGSIYPTTNVVGSLGTAGKYWAKSYIAGLDLGSNVIDNVNRVTSYTGQNFSINTDAGNVITATAAGNVGIGLIGPVAKLEITKNTATSWASSETDWAFRISDGTGDVGLLLGVANELDSAAIQSLDTGISWATCPLLLNPNAGNVGIGTTSPTARLSVAASGSYSMIVGAGKIGSLADPTINTDAATKGYVDALVAAATSTGITGSGTANYLPKWTSGSGLGNSVIYETGGNIGIGTTSPGYKLDVMTGSGPYTAMRIGFPGSNLGMYFGRVSTSGYYSYIGDSYYENTGNWRAPSNTGSAIRFKDAGGIGFFLDSGLTPNTDYTPTERITINTVGNLGIGITTPNSKLQVLGQIRSGGVGADGTLILDNGTDGGGGATLSYTNDSGLIISQTRGIASNILMNYSSGIEFQTEDSTSPYTKRTRMVIRHGDSGNVGIGTTNPTARLEVAAGGSYSIYAGSARIGNVADPVSNSDAATKSYVDTTAGGGVGSGTSGQTLRHNGTSWVANSTLYNNGSNVGIGTTTPVDKLQVYGNTFLGRISGYPYKSLWTWESDNTGYAAGIGYQKNDGTNQKLFVWWRDSVVETNINSVLNVATPGHTFDGTHPNTGRTIGVSLSASGASYFTGGNVGIGTTSPGANLEVVNTTGAAWARGLNVLNSGLTSGQNVMFYLGQSLSTKNVAQMYFHYDGVGSDNNYYSFGLWGVNNVLNVLATGNVGIGTTSPATRLEVAANGSYSIFAGNAKIGNLADPTISTDAATKNYVDSMIASATSTGVTGSGTANYLTKWTGTSVVGNSAIYETGGNIGIGNTDPGSYKVKITGNVAVTGTLSTQTGSDFAEEFMTKENLEPGTVVVMSSLGYKSVEPCQSAYDKKVVGIVSDNPSIIAGRVESRYKAVVAMMGVVSVKVSDINGDIERGDLLTTSSISGYAMKARSFREGTIIGKAMEDLSGREGTIKVLVNLQ